MNKPIPTVRKYMTPSPLSIERHATLATAHELMRTEQIRHLPVLEGGKLVGIVSLGDLHLIETLNDVDPARVRVEDAMTPGPYVVSPDSPLDEVVADMAAHKYGSAVVMQGHKVVGLFTTVDAMQAFADLLHGRLSR
jgi:acetoin utilization protein AcuB